MIIAICLIVAFGAVLKGISVALKADDKAQWERERQERHAACEEGVRQYRLAQLSKREI